MYNQSTFKHLNSPRKSIAKSNSKRKYFSSQHQKSLLKTGSELDNDKKEMDNFIRENNQTVNDVTAPQGDVTFFISLNNMSEGSNIGNLADSYETQGENNKPLQNISHSDVMSPEPNSSAQLNDINISLQDSENESQILTMSQSSASFKETDKHFDEQGHVTTDVVNKAIPLSDTRTHILKENNTITNNNVPPIFIPCTLSQSPACFTAPNCEKSPPCVMWGMLTPTLGEYTSITDNIDTSCMIDCSPPCSPRAKSSIMFSFSDSFHESKAKNRDISSADYKHMDPKIAEKIEHQDMETLMLKRLQQISQDELDNISDIAKVVVAELAADCMKQISQEDSGSEVSSIPTQEEFE
ncbi:hypothetical protein Btru_034540 [Bulinus truncatus]|nr:hypothetical protein Btru_034540 [Bulinus truncatus]